MNTQTSRARLLISSAIMLFGSLGAGLKQDETVIFFPTFAAEAADGKSWKVHLHAWVYEAEESSLKRKLLLAQLAKRLDLTDQAAESQMFHERARLFLVDNESGKRFSVRMADETFILGPSLANGHITSTLSVSAGKVGPLFVTNKRSSAPWVTFEADVPEKSAATFQIPFISAQGVSVISDVDDTIKISEVLSRRALLNNTFCNEFRPVPGMADVYRTWSAQGAFFHYVSASPWQLNQLMKSFLDLHGFPPGSLTLKTFRWKDRSFYDLFAKSGPIKRPFIDKILGAFPKRRFILVGDSGEQDPELYAEVARSNPEQIAKIFIRNSSSDAAVNPRVTEAFAGLPPEKWAIFTDPAELQGMTAGVFDDPKD